MTTKKACEEVKQCVQQKFSDIRACLDMREKLLLRQLDVIAQQMERSNLNGAAAAYILDAKTATNENDFLFLVENEDELLAAIRSFGRFHLDNVNLALQDLYLKQEDYITPTNDHETMYKCLQQNGNVDDIPVVLEDEEQPTSIVVDFSKNKSLIEHNAKNMNESIINITLAEAKELIRKAKNKREQPVPPLNLEELNDELESSIAEAVSSLARESPENTKFSQTSLDKKYKKSRFQPKITINNCNGTINLRNISNLTINCASEDAVNADIPLQQEASQNNENDAENVTTTDFSKNTNSTNNSKQSSISNSVTKTNYMETSSTGDTTPTTTTGSNSNYSSNASSRSQSRKQKKSQQNLTDSYATSSFISNVTSQANTNSKTSYPNAVPHVDDDDDDDVDNRDVTCDFYNRLLNEIKNSLKEKTKQRVVDNSQYLISSSRSVQSAAADSTSDANSNATSVTTTKCNTSTGPTSTQPGRRLVLKNFENLRIVLEANSDEETFHPVQIEQWLAEIISETDLEPMPNTDILEHSKIHTEDT
ncbi:probable cyclin-dependent serine/threonine-protein kinase DDB_G0292550 [Teleopsis dalmanni]|uniref:probable cyclin-dependent serine/threonine-protein kinase DDB_G0292550 n=1 Tax=Teleopsis dalmanni TaxID=139649 RepID=UPI0018CFDE79|nr:probable cyclin-dependent serine/threonine-protein kinase DDB_G0292550 [Teleopsis dalmanni]